MKWTELRRGRGSLSYQIVGDLLVLRSRERDGKSVFRSQKWDEKFPTSVNSSEVSFQNTQMMN